MKVRKILALALIAALCLAAASCGGARQPENPEDTTRTVSDFYGNEVTVPQKVEKIATGKTVATHLVAIVGGPECLACLGAGFNYKEGNLCKEVYPGLENLQEMGDSDLNVETVLALAPDVVLISSAAPEGNDTGNLLKEAGIAVAYYNLASSADLIKLVEMTSAILGTEQAAANAKKYVDYYKKAMEETTPASSPENAPVVAYSRGSRGICGPNSMPGEWIKALGAVNAGEVLGIKPFVGEVTVEEFMNVNPEVIFCESAAAKDIFAGSEYAGIKAVQEGKVYIVPYGMVCSGLATAENPLVWYFAANILFPETYNYDMEAMLAEYYKTFYNYELTQAQIDAALYK
ncbi:MAG: ABC transporter substrate-binding protein [Eubacteriaceae bacterium]|nr:ABC transporter substrate-binding protein [Eubacteriaceae bacterium]